MNKSTIAAKIRSPREPEELIDEARAEADALRDSIKSYMGDKEEVKAGGYHVTWRTVKGHRFDSAALKRAMPDTCAAFTKETITRRFCVGKLKGKSMQTSDFTACIHCNQSIYLFLSPQPEVAPKNSRGTARLVVKHPRFRQNRAKI